MKPSIIAILSASLAFMLLGFWSSAPVPPVEPMPEFHYMPVPTDYRHQWKPITPDLPHHDWMLVDAR